MYSKCELKFIVERLKFSVTVENTFSITIDTMLTENILYLYYIQFQNMIRDNHESIIFNLIRIILGTSKNNL